jgi:hypothetical protein
VNLTKLYSKGALRASICYAALAVGLSVYFHRNAEPEALPFAFLILGFPWSVAAVSGECFSLKGLYCLLTVLSLNAATLYFGVLAVTRLLEKDSE